MITGEPVKSTLQTIVDLVLDHPKLAGLIAFVALAISLSPRATTVGSWICLFVALLFAVAMVAGFREKYRLHTGWIVLMSVAVAAVLGGIGYWLTHAAQETPKTVTVTAELHGQSKLLVNSVEFNPAMKGLSREYNVWFTNIGQEPAQHRRNVSGIGLEDHVLSATETQGKFDNVKNLISTSAAYPNDQQPSEKWWFTKDFTYKSLAVAKKVKRNKAYLYAIVYMTYEDQASGSHETAFCAFYQGDMRIAHLCNGANYYK